MPTIQKGDNRFYIEEGGETLAEITYVSIGEDQIDVNHTYVSEKLRGQGVAGQLVEHIADYARSEGKKVVPTCSYAKAKMEKDYPDLLAK